MIRKKREKKTFLIYNKFTMELYGTHADLNALEIHVESGMIKKSAHPQEANVFIYNYSAMAQFDRVWDNHILQSRGLIVREDGLILGRPMPKFFNYEEYKNQEEVLPWHLPFKVTEKADGSMFLVSGQYSATRGSFVSSQAAWGRELLAEYNLNLDPQISYTFELIHQQNRIVVDYFGARKLVLLAMIETATGVSLPLDYNLGVEVTKHRDVPHGRSPAAILSALNIKNEEGFVVEFVNALRVKIKFEDYKRLHRVVTGTSSKTIWQSLRAGESLNEMLEIVPDEFNIFVRQIMAELTAAYEEIEREGLKLYIEVKDMPTRRDQALRIQALESRAAHVTFKMLDGKSYADGIWKMVEPEYRQPFSSRENV